MEVVTQNKSKTPVKVALFLRNRQFVRSWIDSGLVNTLIQSGDISITVYTTSDLRDRLHQDADYEIVDLGTPTSSKKSLHQLGIGYAVSRRNSETFKFKFLRQFLPETRFFCQQGSFLFRFVWLLAAMRMLLRNTWNSRIHLVYLIPPLRTVLQTRLWFSREEQLLHPTIATRKFDWLLIPADSASGYITDWIIGAREIGLKTLLAIDNWDHLTGKAIYIAKPDFITVMGARCVEHAIKIHNFKPKQVLPFGLPRFDFYKTSLKTLPKLSHDSPKRIIYCGFSLAHSEIEIVNHLAKYFTASLESGVLEIEYRPHPGPLKRFNYSLPLDPRVKRTIHGDLSRTSLPDMNQEFLHSLTSAHVVIGPPTSIVLEAMFIGRPCILDLTDDGYHRTTAAISARRHTHMLDLNYISNLPVANTVNQLTFEVEQLLRSNVALNQKDLTYLCDLSKPLYSTQLANFLMTF